MRKTRARARENAMPGHAEMAFRGTRIANPESEFVKTKSVNCARVAVDFDGANILTTHMGKMTLAGPLCWLTGDFFIRGHHERQIFHKKCICRLAFLKQCEADGRIALLHLLDGQ